MKPSKILLSLDGSSLAESAFPVALALARRWGAELILARIVNPVAVGAGAGLGTPTLVTTLLDSENAAAASYLDRQVERCEGLKVRAIKQIGSARDGLAQIAKEENCELIVMASSGRSGISRWLLGSVAESTLRHAPCPVFLVRPDVPPPPEGGFKNVLVPCDGSPASLSILSNLFPYLAPSSHVTIMRASGLYPVDYAGIIDPLARTAYLEHLEADLKRNSLSEEGIKVEYLVVDGEAADSILTEAEKGSHDLIALSTHGYRGFQHLFLGSVTERVSRHATCPVLAFRHVHKPKA